jgi:hypothetical protein
MSKHLLFDLETITKPEVAENLEAAFEVEVYGGIPNLDLKKSTVDNVKGLIEHRHPSREWCSQHVIAEMEGKNRKGVKDALTSRIEAIDDPIPKKWLVTPELQQIVTFGLSLGVDEPVVWQYREDESEYDEWLGIHMSEFWRMQKEHPVLTCFNGCNFDIPILMLESKRLGIKFPQIKVSSYRGVEYNLLDVMKARYGHDYRGLRASALAAGLPREVDAEDTLVSGANVALAYAEGRYEEIETHCRVDILRLQACCRKYDGVFFDM